MVWKKHINQQIERFHKMKASNQFKVFKNEGGQTISTVDQPVIEKDGLYFKDIDSSGELKVFSDWRNTPQERAEALVKEMSTEEKIGQAFVTSRNPFTKEIGQMEKMMAKEKGIDIGKIEKKSDETGLLDENKMEGSSIFAGYTIPGTTDSILQDKMRNYILRNNPDPETLTDWLNELQKTAEKDSKFIPVLVTTNSRNENGKVVFGMNDAVGVFPAWPGTLGIAAAVLGARDAGIVKEFGEAIRNEWNAAGLKKDTCTWPMWSQTLDGSVSMEHSAKTRN